MISMPDMPNIDLDGIMKHLTETGKRTHQLWLTPDSMAFIARGREYRSEFHINPSYEIQYTIKGDLHLHLHYRTRKAWRRSRSCPRAPACSSRRWCRIRRASPPTRSSWSLSARG